MVLTVFGDHMVMAFADRKWEHRLLSLAHEALETSPHLPQVMEASMDPEILENSYGECESITSSHSRSFYFASNLLPLEKKRAVRALYAFCRVADDIIDEDSHQPEQKLDHWRELTISARTVPSRGVPLAWTETRSKFRIPLRYAEQLLDGIQQDLHKYRYNTFEELSVYCYGVASTVGLMSMHIIGFEQAEAIHYAVKLGVALQMTNILRDVYEDWHAGRLYLPLDELKAYGLREEDIERGQVDDRWRAFMRFQIARNRRLYEEAWPGIPLLHQDGRFAVAAAAGLYEAILDDIENHDYDVFSRRAHVSDSLKLRKLVGIFGRLKSVRMK
jgi:phytoene synthase